MTGRGLGNNSQSQFDRACVICDKPEDYANHPENPFEMTDKGYAHRNCRVRAKLALEQRLPGGTL